MTVGPGLLDVSNEALMILSNEDFFSMLRGFNHLRLLMVETLLSGYDEKL